MRFLIAPQEFKGSLTATQAAHAIAEGVRTADRSIEVVEVPMSDGGPGFVDAMLTALGGQRVEASCSDPLMRPIRASFALTVDQVAVIEMAAASGLVLLKPRERNPLLATTFGTGELIGAALERGARTIIAGLGGSGTVDAGAGAMQALGARLLDAAGLDLPRGGGALARLDRIDLGPRDRRLDAVSIRVATDVRNTLCGEHGAAAVFGPQKGASPDDVRVLDAALRRFAEIVRRDCGVDVASVPGSGAAGGLGAGLMAVAGATIEPGFDLVADVTGLDELVATCDAVITGEGRLDAQTPYGKTVAGVAGMAAAHGRPVGVLAGSVDPAFEVSRFAAVEALSSPGLSFDETMRLAAPLLRAAAGRLAQRLLDQIGR
jgi:glycerate kinase